MGDTHISAPTRFVEGNGIRFAYRRFGQESGVPLLFFQHIECDIADPDGKRIAKAMSICTVLRGEQAKIR